MQLIFWWQMQISSGHLTWHNSVSYNEILRICKLFRLPYPRPCQPCTAWPPPSGRMTGWVPRIAHAIRQSIPMLNKVANINDPFRLMSVLWMTVDSRGSTCLHAKIKAELLSLFYSQGCDARAMLNHLVQHREIWEDARKYGLWWQTYVLIFMLCEDDSFKKLFGRDFNAELITAKIP